MSEEVKALKTIVEELRKVKAKHEKKAERERAKVNNVYVTVKGEKCYSKEEINEWYAADYISYAQSNKYIERLEQKKEKAGQKDYLTGSERVCKVLDGMISNLSNEIRGIRFKEEQERKKQERWEIAKAQGCSYAQFLELEEISRQSEEYERLNRKESEE